MLQICYMWSLRRGVASSLRLDRDQSLVCLGLNGAVLNAGFFLTALRLPFDELVISFWVQVHLFALWKQRYSRFVCQIEY